jgi:hypothetical protein
MSISRIFFVSVLFLFVTGLQAQISDPQIAAQGQLEAYNKQDIEAFLGWYSDDVEVYNFPDELIYKGKDKMRERYSNAWKQNPDQKAEVTNRIINGNTVIDKEHVTGRVNGIENNVIAIYKADKGKISKVYFIRD